MSELQRLLSRAFDRALVQGLLERSERTDDGRDERLVCTEAAGVARALVALQPRLDLGLRVDGTIDQGLLRRGARTGDRDFDRTFRAVADEDARANALLSPALRAGILEFHARAAEIVIEDGAVVVEHPEDAVARAGAETLAGLVDAARAGVPCARVLADLRTALASFAARNGLSCETTPVRVAGPLDGLTVQLSTARTGFDEHTATIVVAPPTPLGQGLLLLREGSGAVALARARTMALSPTGRASLEGLFVGRTDEPDALARLVDEGLAAALARCARVARDVAVTDTEILVELRCTPDAPREPLEVLQAAVEAGRRLGDNVRMARARAGPYR